MRSRAFLNELVVPAIVVTGTLLFWFSLREAPSISQRVPLGVIAFIGLMAVIVVAKAALLARGDDEAPGPAPVETFRIWLAEWGQRLAFIGLAIGYYLAFGTLGFTAANFLFLVAALVVAGHGWDRAPLAAAWQIALIAILATTAFHFLAQLMDFNVPRGPFGI